MTAEEKKLTSWERSRLDSMPWDKWSERFGISENQIIEKGGAVPESVYNSPAKIPVVECPSLSDDSVLLTDPKNLVVVNTYGMKIRKTTEGKEAIMKDKRFYVIHFDFDPIIEEMDAAAIIKGIK